jgi:hypothetical protein
VRPNGKRVGKQVRKQRSAGLQPLPLHPQDPPPCCRGRAAGSEHDARATAPRRPDVCPAAGDLRATPSLHLATLAKGGRKGDWWQ